MAFPQFKVIDSIFIETMDTRTGENNLGNSGMVPWIRLASGVGNGLVLESVNIKNTFKTEYGGDTTSGKIGRDFDDKPVYAKDDRTLRPSPVIDGISVENGSNGLSRKAKFSIKCYTLKQANTLSQYFYEPGYVVFIEYGWNTKLSMEQRANLKSGSEKAVCEIVKSNNYEEILKKRKKSKGTYDGFMGYITGGGFTSTDNGGYQLDVELTTLGEIPAYLQTHKVASGEKVKITPEPDYKNIDPESDSIKDIGISLFKQMWNRLPKAKKIVEVKSLITQNDDRGTPWSDAGNFVNMDTENREHFATAIAGSKSETSKSEVNIPDSANIFSDISYIRMELAFQILNTSNLDFEPRESTSCTGETNVAVPLLIQYKDTILRAHKHMFSLDDKLFIPNRHHPNFDLMKSVFSKEANKGKTPIGSPSYTIDKEGKLTMGSGSISARDQMKMSDLNASNGDDRYTFPQQSAIEYKGASDEESIHADGGTYGYLKDLYINFEYFKSVIESSNFVAKDIVFEMLNTLSMSANSMWQFELVDDGKSGLTIRDLSFLGKPPKKPIKTFYTQGKKTSFLTSAIDMKMSANMRNQILATRQSQTVDTSSETVNIPKKVVGQFWGGASDLVLDKLYQLRPKFDSKKTDANGNAVDTEETTVEPTKEEILEKNLSEFMEYGTVVGRTLPPGTSTDKSWWKVWASETDLDDVFLTTAWADPTLFRTFEMGTQSPESSNGVLLGIEFNFETLGISGLQVGNVFKLADVPTPYKDKVFQIMSTSNSISGTTWKTSINSQLRNITWIE